MIHLRSLLISQPFWSRSSVTGLKVGRHHPPLPTAACGSSHHPALIDTHYGFLNPISGPGPDSGLYIETKAQSQETGERVICPQLHYWACSSVCQQACCLQWGRLYMYVWWLMLIYVRAL